MGQIYKGREDTYKTSHLLNRYQFNIVHFSKSEINSSTIDLNDININIEFSNNTHRNLVLYDDTGVRQINLYADTLYLTSEIIYTDPEVYIVSAQLKGKISSGLSIQGQILIPDFNIDIAYPADNNTAAIGVVDIAGNWHKVGVIELDSNTIGRAINRFQENTLKGNFKHDYLNRKRKRNMSYDHRKNRII